MMIYILEIPRWRPALLDELMCAVKGKIRLKKRDWEMVCAYALQAKILRATGKRWVSLHVTLGKGMREFDVDAWQKSGLDAMKHAGLIMDEQHLQSSRQNSQPSQQIDRSFLSLGNKPFRLKLSRCC
jgi:hypothetical protein